MTASADPGSHKCQVWISLLASWSFLRRIAGRSFFSQTACAPPSSWVHSLLGWERLHFRDAWPTFKLVWTLEQSQKFSERLVRARHMVVSWKLSLLGFGQLRIRCAWVWAWTQERS